MCLYDIAWTAVFVVVDDAFGRVGNKLIFGLTRLPFGSACVLVFSLFAVVDAGLPKVLDF